MTSLHAASGPPIPPVLQILSGLVRPHAEANQNLMRCVGCAGGQATAAKRRAAGTLGQDMARVQEARTLYPPPSPCVPRMKLLS